MVGTTRRADRSVGSSDVALEVDPLAAAMAAAEPSALRLLDQVTEPAEALGDRPRQHYPALQIMTGSNNPVGCRVVVNATALGMKPADPPRIDATRITPEIFVGEVAMKEERTPLPRAVVDKGCTVQVGTDMLFEIIPAFLAFFGFGTSTLGELRSVATPTYRGSEMNFGDAPESGCRL